MRITFLSSTNSRSIDGYRFSYAALKSICDHAPAKSVWSLERKRKIGTVFLAKVQHLEPEVMRRYDSRAFTFGINLIVEIEGAEAVNEIPHTRIVPYGAIVGSQPEEEITLVTNFILTDFMLVPEPVGDWLPTQFIKE